jgi:hypothetical protein
VVACVLAALALAGGSVLWWRGRTLPAGPATGELTFSGHNGIFHLKPTFCRKAVTGRGAGVYDPVATALAFGYFDDLDGGEWVEAQGPGVIGATRFDRGEDCMHFEAAVYLDGGLASGHVEVVCDAPKSPGVTHVEGEIDFQACR